MEGPPPGLLMYEDEQLAELISQLHLHMMRCGYTHVQVDAMKEADLFLNKAGDQIIANLFTFDRFGKQLALRPEFTALAAHRYIHAFPEGDQVVRWQFNGSVFRDDYQQRDSNYQIMSMGAELFGMQDSVLADAEMIAMGFNGLTRVSGISGIEITIGHSGLIKHLLATYQLDDRTERFILSHLSTLASNSLSPDQLLQQLDQYTTTSSKESAEDSEAGSEADTQHMLDVLLDATDRGATMGGRSRQDIVNRILKKRRLASRRDDIATAIHDIHQFVTLKGPIDEVREQIAGVTGNEAFQNVFDTWIRTIELAQVMLGSNSDVIRLFPGLLRDWNYYTGIVFELVNHETGTRYGGGGRYDELVRMIGGGTVNVPAVGFAYDIDAVLNAMPQDVGNPESVYNLVSNSSDHGTAYQWASALRRAGISIAMQTQNVIGANIITLDKNGATYEGQTVQTHDDLISLLTGA